jgi:trehalose/maltose hydrolase-like predicted phosphorylase
MSHFQSHNAVYSSVEEELWLIFTFYALHFDPTLPEQWKSAAFVKFAKDCQIVNSKNCYVTNNASGKLSVPMLELEIAKLVSDKTPSPSPLCRH